MLAEVQALPDRSHAACQSTCLRAESKCASQLPDCLADATCAQLQGCVVSGAYGDKTGLVGCALKTPSSTALATLKYFEANCPVGYEGSWPAEVQALLDRSQTTFSDVPVQDVAVQVVAEQVAREEQWAYDTFGRFGLPFVFALWLITVGLHSMRLVFTERRSLWPARSVIAVFLAAQHGTAKLDITSSPWEDSPFCIPMERFVAVTTLRCALGLTIGHSVLTPTPFWQSFVYALFGVTYLIHFAWAVRLYGLASPQYCSKGSPESAGEAWSLTEWPAPTAFQQAVHLVSAPQYLEPGQSCLQQQMEAAKVQHGQAPKETRSVAPALYSWLLFLGATVMMISVWVLIICGRVFGVVTGERQSGRFHRHIGDF